MQTDFCNKNTDPWFQVGTAFGSNVDANKVPYLVIPNNFNRSPYSIGGGQIAAVIYNGKVTYVVLADTGPPNIIGEASPATARILGIDPDPHYGGSGGPVTYILFAGTSARAPITEAGHAEALSRGKQLAEQFLRDNGALGLSPGRFSSPRLRIAGKTVTLDGAGAHSFRILDAQGRLVQAASGAGAKTYSLAGLPAGVYTVKAESGGVSGVIRLALF
jgi:hypothetical protein